MMDLDEAIQHCEEVMMENLEKTKDRNASDPIAISCGECASEHRQLAEWLKELKDYRERIPSYEAGYNDAKREIVLSGEYERAYERGKADAQPKMGHWIFDEILDKHYYCSECKSMGVDYWDYCPNCGTKMQEVKE